MLVFYLSFITVLLYGCFAKNQVWISVTKTHKRALRTVYNDTSLSLHDLLELDNSCSIHHRHLQLLMIEVYKTIHRLNPKYLWDMFCEKPLSYNLRAKTLLKLPKTYSVAYGTNSLHFKACLLWNTLPKDLKACSNLNDFKLKIKKWKGNSCSYNCCK